MDLRSAGQRTSESECFQEYIQYVVVLVLKVETENKAGHLLPHAAVSQCCEEMLGAVWTGLHFAGTNLCSTSRTSHSGRAANM